MPLLATGSSLTMREPRLVNTETHIEARLQTEFTGAAQCWKNLKALDSSLAKSDNDWLCIFREINDRFSVSREMETERRRKQRMKRKWRNGGEKVSRTIILHKYGFAVPVLSQTFQDKIWNLFGDSCQAASLSFTNLYACSIQRAPNEIGTR